MVQVTQCEIEISVKIQIEVLTCQTPCIQRCILVQSLLTLSGRLKKPADGTEGDARVCSQ